MDSVEVISQLTPNPNALRFLASASFTEEGNKVAFDREDLSDNPYPMVQALLGLEGVKGLHFSEESVTVTQDGSVGWENLEESVTSILKTFLPEHNPSVFKAEQKSSRKSHDKDELNTIEDILDQEIRPALQADGGDIEVMGLEDQLLMIRYEGACGSCPSSMTGTLEAIRRILKQDFDSSIDVVAI